VTHIVKPYLEYAFRMANYGIMLHGENGFGNTVPPRMKTEFSNRGAWKTSTAAIRSDAEIRNTPYSTCKNA
jgi:hypothetical protein